MRYVCVVLLNVMRVLWTSIVLGARRHSSSGARSVVAHVRVCSTRCVPCKGPTRAAHPTLTPLGTSTKTPVTASSASSSWCGGFAQQATRDRPAGEFVGGGRNGNESATQQPLLSHAARRTHQRRHDQLGAPRLEARVCSRSWGQQSAGSTPCVMLMDSLGARAHHKTLNAPGGPRHTHTPTPASVRHT